MSDAFLVLAQAAGGLSCFLLPRFTSDGVKNSLYFQRLKDKLGNRSNASGEVEFHSARAQIIGAEGRGVLNIMEMVRHTRLDCTVGSAATMRRAVNAVLHHCAHRKAFGKPLIEQPLMLNVLADLCLETEAAVALAFRLARGFDESENDGSARAFTRLATAVGKYWITKRAVAVVAEALECIGGNGYVEESVLPRLYRDAPVNSIWEGSGNIQCLDALRAIQKEPECLAAFFSELNPSCGAHPAFDKFVGELETELSDFTNAETRARYIVEKMALALQAALLLQTAPEYLGAAFCASRLTNNRTLNFGALPADTEFDTIITRGLPVP